MTVRQRVSVLAAILVLAVLGSVAFVWKAHSDRAKTLSSAPAVVTGGDLATVSKQPRMIFRSTALGSEYGRVAMVPLSNTTGPRTFTPQSCERVYATAVDAICLSADRGLVTTYKSQILDSSWSPAHDLPLTGLPSRARLSYDGSLAATTTFVFGDSYANPGKFSTRTVVSRKDGTTIGDIEKFKLTVDGKVISAADKNLWGVTFAGNDNDFYATAASGGKTWLVKGSLSGKTVTAVRGDVECPSLSPDGTRIAFKKHGDLPAGKWHLAVYDLQTGKETLLAEQNSVDDQVEWLDNQTIVYGLPRTADNGAATSDIWQVPADGSGSPQVIVRDAWSPVVVR
ncbi:TolB family protein [Actinoplanes sp. CA-142083]|uniref:TolB family protein n=1 Tax=Actinoplanes sp. CA-142083 TaxID=3239903 RepID=UPI003D8DC6E8